MHNRTRTLVKGLQRVTDVKLLTNRVEELSFHLLEFPEMRGVAVQVCLFVSPSLPHPPLLPSPSPPPLHEFQTVADQESVLPDLFFRRACCRAFCACARPETSPCRLR